MCLYLFFVGVLLKGQELLLKVQGDISMYDFMPEPVHGSHMVNWMDEYFGDSCLSEEDDEALDRHFMALVVQRGFDEALIPIYDMVNHNRGKVNTVTRPSVTSEDGFGMYATRDILAGEELFFAYHDCKFSLFILQFEKKNNHNHTSNIFFPLVAPDSGTVPEYWGTPEILRDFGFVEPYPHRFHM